MNEFNLQIKRLNRMFQKLQADAALLEPLRELAKTDEGRLTDFGVKLLRTCADAGVSQIVIANILEVTPSAVTQQLAKA